MLEIEGIGKCIENENGIARGIDCIHSVHEPLDDALNFNKYFIAQKINGQKEEEIKSLNMNQEELQAVNAQLVAKQQQQNAVNKRLKAENERLRNENAVYEEERKEAQLKITELEEKVKELSLNTEKFMEWDWKQIHFWIMKIDDGKFQKYDAVLKKALSEAEMEGEDLLEITPFTIKCWGIKDRKDAAMLNGHIQELVQQNGTQKAAPPMPFGVAPKENEGGLTEMIPR